MNAQGKIKAQFIKHHKKVFGTTDAVGTLKTSWPQFFDHLESTFRPGDHWDNYEKDWDLGFKREPTFSTNLHKYAEQLSDLYSTYNLTAVNRGKSLFDKNHHMPTKEDAAVTHSKPYGGLVPSSTKSNLNWDRPIPKFIFPPKHKGLPPTQRVPYHGKPLPATGKQDVKTKPGKKVHAQAFHPNVPGMEPLGGGLYHIPHTGKMVVKRSHILGDGLKHWVGGNATYSGETAQRGKILAKTTVGSVIGPAGGTKETIEDIKDLGKHFAHDITHPKEQATHFWHNVTSLFGGNLDANQLRALELQKTIPKVNQFHKPEKHFYRTRDIIRDPTKPAEHFGLSLPHLDIPPFELFDRLHKPETTHDQSERIIIKPGYVTTLPRLYTGAHSTSIAYN